MADNITAAGALNYVRSSTTEPQKSSYSIDTGTFFKLLVAQMQYQDPLEPQSNSEFLAELAQMNTQEQMQIMNTTLNTSKALSMVGKVIYAEVLNPHTGIIEAYEGIVDSVIMQNGTAYVVIGKNAIPIDNILAVGNPTEDDSSETVPDDDTVENTDS